MWLIRKKHERQFYRWISIQNSMDERRPRRWERFITLVTSVLTLAKIQVEQPLDVGSPLNKYTVWTKIWTPTNENKQLYLCAIIIARQAYEAEWIRAIHLVSHEFRMFLFIHVNQMWKVPFYILNQMVFFVDFFLFYQMNENWL